MIVKKDSLTDVAIYFAEMKHPKSASRAGDAILDELKTLVSFVRASVVADAGGNEDASNEALASIDRLRKLAEALQDT